jgi:hypothetical protein
LESLLASLIFLISLVQLLHWYLCPLQVHAGCSFIWFQIYRSCELPESIRTHHHRQYWDTGCTLPSSALTESTKLHTSFHMVSAWWLCPKST